MCTHASDRASAETNIAEPALLAPKVHVQGRAQGVGAGSTSRRSTFWLLFIALAASTNTSNSPSVSSGPARASGWNCQDDGHVHQKDGSETLSEELQHEHNHNHNGPDSESACVEHANVPKC